MTKQYFTCRQYDWIVDYLGVSLRSKNRYELRTKLAQKASFRSFSHMVVFEEPWFRNFSDKGRCAVLIDELGHAKTRDKGIRGALLTLFMFFGWAIIAGVLAFEVRTITGVPILFGFSFLGLMALFWSFGMRAVFRHAMWPIEFYCDEIATLYMGEEATKEELKTLSKKIPRFWSTHPPTAMRIERVEAVGRRSPKPLIDFESLNERIPQEIVAA